MREELVAFEDEGRALLRVVRDLSADDLDRPTNCPPWNLAELIVHIAGSVRVGGPSPAASDTVVREPADYYRRPERDTTEYRDHNVRMAQDHAVQVRSQTTIAEFLATTLRATTAQLAGDDLDRVIEIGGVGPMRLGDWLATRVISLAAHGLDVAITLDLDPWTTPSALRVVRPVFRSLLGRAVPAELGWTDQRLLAVATGRASLTEAEQTVLGADAARFPLLS